MSENKTMELAFEALLEDAAKTAEEELLKEQLPSDDEIVFSAAHEAKMQKLFRKARIEKKLKAARKIAFRAACIIVAFLTVSAFAVLSVEALRIKVLNFLFDDESPYSVYRLNSEGYSDDVIDISYVPEGFKVSEKEIYERTYLILFTNNNDEYFNVTIRTQLNSNSIDSEKSYSEEIIINGRKALYTENENVRTILFEDERYSYTIFGNISLKELQKIAKNVKTKK